MCPAPVLCSDAHDINASTEWVLNALTVVVRLNRSASSSHPQIVVPSVPHKYADNTWNCAFISSVFDDEYTS